MSTHAREADALWRATVYLAVAMLHLEENPLLLRPLEEQDVKPQPAGHWGTVPGTAWALVHVALAAGRLPTSREVVPVLGAGHAGVVQLALAWLTGDLGRLRASFGRDVAGLTRLIRSFPEVDGLGNEVHPLLPGGSYLGGCLGGALAFAQGMALNAPHRIVAPIVGDGECETPTAAAAWLAGRELPNGAVLPILHLNGFRMGSRSLLSTMTGTQLNAYLAGLGWTPFAFHVRDGGLGEHAAFQDLLRQAVDATSAGERVVVVLRCLKGWGAPEMVAGRRLLGTSELHKTPLVVPRVDPCQRQQLQDWLASYRPGDLFGGDGHPSGALAAAVGQTRLHSPRQPQRITDVDQSMPVVRFGSFGEVVSAVLRTHADRYGLHVFSPDELASNRLANLAGETWVREVLAEEVLLGWLAGWTASGRRGVLVSYEAFAALLTAGLAAHLKQRRLADEGAGWPSMNLLLTSYGWHNVYTHGDPSLVTALLASGDSAVRVYTPAGPSRAAVALEDALHSYGRVNIIVAGKHPTRSHPLQTLPQERSRGLAIWPHLSDEGEPDLTIVCAGDLPAAVTADAVGEIRTRHRRRVRMVNVHDLTVLGDPRVWPAGLGDDELGHYFGAHAPVLIATLGHPMVVWGLLAGRLRRPVQVIGWREPPAPLGQRRLAAFCGLDRNRLVEAAAGLMKWQEVPA